MRHSSVAGLTALALTGGSLLSLATPAQAADAAVLYVRKMSTACSDTGAGTLAQPYCSIAPAVARVTAGQTVDVGQGSYPERVTVASSGTPDQPITILASNVATLSGPSAGFVIDGQHDIVLQNLRVDKAVDVPALDLRNAAGIRIQGGSYAMADAPTAPAVRLTGVARSTLKNLAVSGKKLVGGMVLDASTTGVVVSSSFVSTSSSSNLLHTDHTVGIRVDGPGNTLLNDIVTGFTDAGVVIGPDADDMVLANNQVNSSGGVGIHNRGASGTAITNNTVRDHCLDGIRVDGASAGVSVQNNVLISNGLGTQDYCDSTADPTAEIGVYDDAGKTTTIDYNNTTHGFTPAGTNYSWNGTRMSLESFRSVSGQAAHDKNTAYTADAQDSANSAAPGYQTTDRTGAARADNPAVPNTGAGPIAYADRGATEALGTPVANVDPRLDLGASSVTLDASASTPGYVPLTSYVFDFGDGTVVTESTPVASHTYAAVGTYQVSVTVSGSDDRAATSTQNVSVLRRTGTIGLLSLYNLRYAASATAGQGVVADQLTLGASGQFDLADAGNGQVALFSRATRRYLGNGGSVLPLRTDVTANEKFDLVRNSDGTVSLGNGGTYVSNPSGTAPLTVVATTIGTREKFYRVNVAEADRSFKAGANGKYVTAESAGAKPLIASRTSVGPWERFDLADLGNGQVGVFAHANNRFVCADNAGLNPLIANRTSAGAWETFTLIRNADGTVSLKATVNSRYVTADSGGAKPLIANRTAIGPWEKFTLGG
ncbi:PKD domain-containing protein [Micromonospora halotolerans]|uniref:PKD domain-containing protein n=1 Tax=Micromonospora halotolerans TaxID=709879 RepID=A0ABZ0A2H4_9ACTN|nr:PKD domain-containing protein [Micromonospora halotolerans]WNM41761.1 PKD domain-containing protein [Micromonospora halotolerans]